jgi:hypothetical protein
MEKCYGSTKGIRTGTRHGTSAKILWAKITGMVRKKALLPRSIIRASWNPVSIGSFDIIARRSKLPNHHLLVSNPTLDLLW